jgi:biopolymer transport protein ExbD
MRRKRQRRARKPAELMLVPMIDIFVVLVTFLLMTAVFSRIAILELDLPSAASPSASEPTFRLEVIVRKQGLELTNGSSLIATIPNKDGGYDLKSLSELALALKRDYPDADDASVLMEPEIEYDHLIQVMDAIRSVELPPEATAQAVVPDAAAPAPTPARALVQKAGAPKPVRVALFTDIAVGDAP